ncbi:MAG: hypothetical protein AB2A00_15425 [Myxococcota bacterium]
MRSKLMAVTAIIVVGVFFGRGAKGEPVEVAGRVVRVSGQAPVRVDDPCTVGVTPESRGGYPCRVSITCGKHTLYGGPRLGGYAKCSVSDGKYTAASDDMLSSRDGDPWLQLDVTGGRATVRDNRPEHDVVIEMDTTPLASAGARP